MATKNNAVVKYVIYPCKGGWLLNVQYANGKVESEVYTDGMRCITRIASSEGLLDDDTEKRVEPNE